MKFETEALADPIRHGDELWEAEIVTSLHLLLKLVSEDAKPTRSPEWPLRHRCFHQALVAGPIVRARKGPAEYVATVPQAFDLCRTRDWNQR